MFLHLFLRDSVAADCDSGPAYRFHAAPTVRGSMSEAIDRSVQDAIADYARAVREKRIADAVAGLDEALAIHARTGQAVPRSIHFDLGRHLYELGRLAEAETRLREGLARRPADFDLNNVLGVVLKAQGRFDEALAALDRAAKADPRSLSPLVNRGNIQLGLKQWPKVVETYSRLVRLQPKVAEYHRLLGIGLRFTGVFDKAGRAFETARQLAPGDIRSWTDQASFLRDTGRPDDALALLGRAIDRFGPTTELVRTRASILRGQGRHADAVQWLLGLVQDRSTEAAPLHQLGLTLQDTDPDKANACFAQALALAPTDPRLITDAANALNRTRGPDEPRHIDTAYRLVKRRIGLGGAMLEDAHALRNVLLRCADYEAVDALGSFDQLGAFWGRIGSTAALHLMLGQVRTPEDRRRLVGYHRACAKLDEGTAEFSPITRPPAVTGRAKIRIGLMSSDLRDHPVSYFTAPLLERYDRSRFEIYAYSWFGGPIDAVQTRLAGLVDVFRHAPSISDRDAAQLIASDSLDILFELGGSTHMNKLKVMTWKPAPRQASWLGYPHSAGHAAIDRLLLDPYTKPADPALILEKPFSLARSWVAFDKMGFGPVPDIDPATPQERTGQITFGSMNNPFKFNPDMLATWAAVLARGPGSRLLLVRPEGAVPAFRDNLSRRFAGHGIDPQRIVHLPIRGQHLQHYNSIDVALDTFPQTGGTTTCETLWMGVPCVSLVGEAFFERLSYSNLSNAGLGELACPTVEAYVEKAVAVAADTGWRTELRRTMRELLRSHPLGRTDLFVADFQDAATAWMDEARP